MENKRGYIVGLSLLLKARWKMKWRLQTFNYLLYTGALSFLLSSCRQRIATTFEEIPSTHSGIHFTNTITETDSFNILDVSNIYNGGGVGIGDFNNDGLQDVYFTGNFVSNKLYLNRGNFQFQDITNVAGVAGNGNCSRGIAVVDINNDGWLDLYVSATLLPQSSRRVNLLYVNQGLNNQHIPVFKEMASEYGLADTSYCTQAAFFDYDNDGDLDVYIANNDIQKDDYPNRFRPIIKDGTHPSSDRLYRNDWSEQFHHPVFTNVSKQAGILMEGYSHAINITDINNDGWKDIYVSNDYLSNDLLWINNKNGTFSEQLTQYFTHTSANSMGNDIADINNDALPDVIVLDMNPEDNYRKKMMLNANSYQTYQNIDYYGYAYQYVRNTLQINQGPIIIHDSLSHPVFSDIAYYAGMAETDWSWTPMVTDFDNDGYRDICITNGFPKDVTDHDFINFRNTAYAVASKKQLLEQIPEVKLHNYMFQNNGNFRFSNVSQQWGFTKPTFSNGAAYADLDNDGDLDIIINNINDEALVYKNNTREQHAENAHFLQIKFQGSSENINGLGATAEIFYNNQKQIWENTPYRGYLSTIQDIAHFGLGKNTIVDSLIITWPNRKKQVLYNIHADTLLTINIANASLPNTIYTLPANSLFTNVTAQCGIAFKHKDRDFIDFNIQKLLPHKFSEYGPALAAGDLNGDGLDDLVCGGSFFYSATVFFQKKDGTFSKQSLLSAADALHKQCEDEAILLFDADGDNDLDIYIASGGYEAEPNTSFYQDKLYVNNGRGHFIYDSLALPKNYTSKFCVRAFDYDNDGDLDVFVSGRVEPWNYPKAVSSCILRNDSKKGMVRFTNVTNLVAKDLLQIGLVCDAICSDFDNDGWTDLILAGEWMPLTFLKNNKGVFVNVTASSGLQNEYGFWNSLAAGDFDNDGDVDYIAGNLGENSFYKANKQYPVYITAKDFDNNESFDAFPSLYLPTSMQDTQRREYPAQTRDDIVKQMISMRFRFQNYKSFAMATMDSVLPQRMRANAIRLKANYLSSVFIKNNGNAHFTITPLPPQAQWSVLCGMLVEDVDGDGNLDIIINGNDYGTEVSVGRYDAFHGLILKGNGKGNFKTMSVAESGIFIPHNGKALVKLKTSKENYLIAASQNKDSLLIFKPKLNSMLLPSASLVNNIVIFYKNGNKQKRELYYGASYLSQSASFFNINGAIDFIEVNYKNGTKEKLTFQNNRFVSKK